MPTTKELQKAKIAKEDEFYTQYYDIEVELSHHKKHFNNATVFCNCDDPTTSNFWKYFHINFAKLNLKRLISTHYKKGKSTYRLEYVGGNDDKVETGTVVPLVSDGDFRSTECVQLLQEADIIVTNPPFSLFREYITKVVNSQKKVLIIGNMNSITTKNVFPLFKDGKLWYGYSIHSGDRKFTVPDDYPLEAASCGIDDEGKRYIRVKGVRWFTNIDYKERHIPLDCTEKYLPIKYKKYDNYDAISVDKISEIPCDYTGEMGVPITFMDKYCPEQFKIIGISGNLAHTVILPTGKKGSGRFYINGKRLYDRIVIRYTDEWMSNHPAYFMNKFFDINNRRYTGSKYKLMPWIKNIISQYCIAHNSLFDVFGGTGVVTASLLNMVDRVIINDFLYSNEVIYHGFFGKGIYTKNKLEDIRFRYNNIDRETLPDNYVSENFGNKYFRSSDAKLIGFIRQDIEDRFNTNNINQQERYILLASLLYSFDKCANTVGHYDAYIKGKEICSEFVFELIRPIKTDVDIQIFRENSNTLAPKINTDIAFIDPPYNSRQYSRFYHVMETITKWDKPKLSGVAMKPPEENMSDYCKNSASKTFADLILKIKARYIVVTYNNTYDSKSNSSQNKINLEQIKEILESRGNTRIFEKFHNRFNAGKTDKTNHKEYVFLTTVER